MTLDIMMPFYGDPALFRLAVQSVLNQSDPRWRLVIVDDLYPDRGPGHWVESLADSRIEYVRNDVNLGVSGNFEKCADLARAPYATIMGCDDLLLPNYVSRVHALYDQFPDADYLQLGVEVMDASGRASRPLADRVKDLYRPRVPEPRTLSGEFLAASLLRGNWTYFPSIAWKTSRLKQHPFRRDFEVVLDLALQLDIVESGGVLILDNSPNFRYRRHAASVSSWMADDGSRFTEEERFFHEYSQRMRARGWHRAARVASLHLSSRLNAATRLPSSLKAKDARGTRTLLKHIGGRA